MKITLNLKSDSHNTDSCDEIELMEHADAIYIMLGNREVSVNKVELLGAIKLLCEDK